MAKQKKLNFNGLSIDTRTIKKIIYFWQSKENYDGNKFINNAFKRGASCAIALLQILKVTKNIIKIKNTILFLNQFAKLKRDCSSAKIIAVTGSAGKHH